jgi:hypothetical protein
MPLNACTKRESYSGLLESLRLESASARCIIFVTCGAMLVVSNLFIGSSRTGSMRDDARLRASFDTNEYEKAHSGERCYRRLRLVKPESPL